MHVIDNDSVKGKLLKCAKEHKGLILSGEAEPLLDDSGCPDVFCEDCTKKDCELKKLGLVGDNS